MDNFATTTKHIKKSPQVHKVNVCAMCAGHDDNPLMRRIQMSLCLEELNPVGGGGWGISPPCLTNQSSPHRQSK